MPQHESPYLLLVKSLLYTRHSLKSITLRYKKCIHFVFTTMGQSSYLSSRPPCFWSLNLILSRSLNNQTVCYFPRAHVCMYFRHVSLCVKQINKRIHSSVHWEDCSSPLFLWSPTSWFLWILNKFIIINWRGNNVKVEGNIGFWTTSCNLFLFMKLHSPSSKYTIFKLWSFWLCLSIMDCVSVSPPNLSVDTLTPNVMVFGGGVFGR